MTTQNSKRFGTSDSASASGQLEALMTQYAAMVWKTAAVYLKDPEDIKECVNDTFLEYYLHQDRYDPEKGSLAAFLSAIARKRAVSAYRKNLSSYRVYEKNSSGEQASASKSPAAFDDDRKSMTDMENIADSEAMPDRIEERLDLENAMASLAPEDFDIIRMKYYDSMTVREIAEAMNLPYETVKKRHQRSLSKLRLILMLITVLALAALLSACAYMLLRHFGIVPGYGANVDADRPFYILEEPVYGECDQYSVEIRKALLTEDKLTLVALLHRTEVIEEDISIWSTFTLGLADLQNGETGESILIEFYEMDMANRTDSENEELLQITWHLKEDSCPAELILDFHDFALRFKLTAAEEIPLENFGYDMGDLGGIMADAYFQDDHLMVDFYMLSDGIYQLSPLYYSGIAITAEAEDGTPLTGSFCIEGSFVVNPVETWDFGLAQPGNYTFFIPYVKLHTWLPESFRIPLSADGEETSWGKEYSVPGGSLTLDGWAYRRPNPRIPEIPEEERAFRRYLLISMTPDREDLRAINFFPCFEWANGSEELLSPVRQTESVTDIGEEETDQDSFWGLGLKWQEGTKPEEICMIGGSNTDIDYVWEHSFTITVTVTK